MAAFTASQTGNWSSSSTWGGAGTPGSGDTVTIGAFTVTVDVDTTVGTSPNDTTTKVIDMTNAASVLSVAAGVTLTVKGNIGHVNGSTHTQAAGSTVTFDNSASGGTPVYTFINVGFTKFNFNGSSGSGATIQAIAGQTFGMGVAISTLTATYATLRRCSSLTATSISGSINITDSTFDTCTQVNWTSTSTTADVILERNTFSSGTHATEDMTLAFGSAVTTGTRRLRRNVFTKRVTYGASKSFEVRQNYFHAGMACSAGATVGGKGFRENFFRHDGLLNGGNGALFPFSTERNYFAVENGTGNPHFVAPTALLGADNTVSQCIFDSQAPDLVDYGDCIIVNTGAVSGGNVVVSKNNIVLRSMAGVGSGTLLTIYNNDTAAALFKAYRNTVNVDNPSVGSYSKRAMLAVAEASNGSAGQVSEAKSNAVWGSSADQGYIGERVQGVVKDIITAAGCTHNWTHNTSAGDNQGGFEDQAASNTLWTAGDAVAASVNANSGTGAPSFYDSTRNAATWCGARGYGAATFAAAKTALQADPSRITDLMNYVFEGFRPQNASMRTAAHDGGCSGSSNYAKSRASGRLARHRSQLAAFGV